MTTTVNNSNESKVVVNRIDFSGSFYKFLGEEIKIGNQILSPGNYKFDYLIKLDDGHKKCNDMAYLFKHGYATKEMKQAREETARTKKRLEELAEIEKEFAKSVEKAKRIYEVKKAVVSFGISWDNVTLYDHRNELCFNWLDCCKKVPSDLINELVCSNTLPEGIEVTNLDKGRE